MKAAIIGAGNISRSHIKALLSQHDIQLVGVADLSAEARAAIVAEYDLPVYADHHAMLAEAAPDYVVICTPHFSHVPLAMDVLNEDIHALVEKPLSIDAAEAERCVRLAEDRGLVLGVNFTRRMTTSQQRVVHTLREGLIGQVTHVTMICAKRYRNMAYYGSGAWRATWKGEGGGVLANQAPHDLDFLIWALGMPSEVLAELDAFRHAIEVEDDVSALLKWPNGATGTFYASTGVVAGSESLEINGTRGSLRLEGNTFTLRQLEADLLDDPNATPPPLDEVQLDLEKDGNPTLKMHQDFVRSIRSGSPFISSGTDALQEVQLANAMLVSGITRQWAPLPVEPSRFREIFNQLLKTRSITATKAWVAQASTHLLTT